MEYSLRLADQQNVSIQKGKIHIISLQPINSCLFFAFTNDLLNCCDFCFIITQIFLLFTEAFCGQKVFATNATSCLIYSDYLLPFQNEQQIDPKVSFWTSDCWVYEHGLINSLETSRPYQIHPSNNPPPLSSLLLFPSHLLQRKNPTFSEF